MTCFFAPILLLTEIYSTTKHGFSNTLRSLYTEDRPDTGYRRGNARTLALFPHLQAFLEEVSNDHFDRDIRFTQEPKKLDQIGRPDFVAMDGLLPIGYIEAERYGRDLNNLTGHAKEQNERFIKNLDKFYPY